MFKINDYDVVLSERNILPLFTFIAKLTRNINSLPEATEGQKHYAKLANKFIAEEACNFIDIM